MVWMQIGVFSVSNQWFLQSRQSTYPFLQVSLLIWMQIDGVFASPAASGITVLAATNRPWDLDEALLRRLAKRVHVGLPDEPQRIALLDLALEVMHLGTRQAKCIYPYSHADAISTCASWRIRLNRPCTWRLLLVL